MIHPNTELRLVNIQIGLGVFATKFIPKGTIIYVADELEIIVAAKDPRLSNDLYRETILKYGYRDQNGNYVISWDHARFVNHCCQCNSISTGFGFEVALCDILPGEEITDEYGLLNIEEAMNVSCHKSMCRKVIETTDHETFADIWDSKIKLVLEEVNSVAQPLYSYLEESCRQQLELYLQSGKNYPSVRQLKLKMPSQKIKEEKLSENLTTVVGEKQITAEINS